jgi:excisionase family DNA binding protein
MTLHCDERAIPAHFGGRSLSLAQASEALHVSRRTLYYWIRDGRLRTVRTSMGSQRVLVASLRAGRLEGNQALTDTQREGSCTYACGRPPTEGMT